MKFLIPWQVKACIVVALGAGVALAYGWTWQRGYDTAIRERTASDAVAVVAKLNDNVAVTLAASETNTVIERMNREELEPVVERIYVDRVRVGKALCPAAPATESESASGGDGGDSTGRLVREDVERDIRALKVRVEEGFAAGRACQEKLKAEGLM